MIIVTGAKGQLGGDVCDLLSKQNSEYMGIDIADLDITNEKAVEDFFENTKANVDIKMVDQLEKVYPLAKEYNVEDKIFYTGVKDEFVEPVKTKSPEISYFLNVKVSKIKKKNKNYLLSLVEKVKKAGAMGINFNYKSASKELVETLHENGLLVSIWTVDDENNMYKILSFGPDNITTRHPDKLSAIVSQKN